MSELWYSLTNINRGTPNKITANAMAKADSPWFSGHFPDDPILPGIAELSIVYDLIKLNEHEKGNDVRITSVKKVRFRQPVKPEESLNIEINPDEKNRDLYSFKIKTENENICTGMIVVEQK